MVDNEFYVEMGEVVAELMDEFTVKNFIYVNKAFAPPQGGEGTPWNVEESFQLVGNQFAGKALFLPDDLEDRQLIRFLKNASTIVGQVNALIEPSEAFSVQQDDVIYRPTDSNTTDLNINQSEINTIDNLSDTDQWRDWKVAAVDPFRPSRTTLFWMVEFKN